MLHVVLLITLWTTCSSEQQPESWIGESIFPNSGQCNAGEGEAPACKGHWYKCEPFNMELVRLDAYGNGAYCWTGWKALCRVRQKVRPAESTPAGTMKIMSYNIFQRPWIASHDGQVELLYRHHSDVDVLVFQEAFLGGCTPEMPFSRTLPFYGWHHVTGIVGSAHTVNGGVMIASKHKLVDVTYHVFKHSTYGTADYYAGKGFVYAKFEKDGIWHHVIGTHLQAQEGPAEDSARYAQAREIRQFMIDKTVPGKHLWYVAGDMNFDGLHFPEKVERLFAELSMQQVPFKPSIEALPSYDPKTNDVVEPGEKPATYDYVGVLENSHIVSSAVEVIPLKYPLNFNYCNGAKLAPYWVYRKSVFCMATKETKHLSDHYPVLATFEYSYD